MMTTSIIIPSYNQAEYLPAAVDSLINQTYSNWECIIVNDGSTDGTAEVAERLCSRDKRIRYFYKENGGLSTARNEGLKIAKGDFIQFLDADDFLEKNKLEASLQLINEKPFLDIVICDFVRCTDDNTVRLPPYCDLKSIDFNYKSVLIDWDRTFTIPIHCGFFRSSLFRNYKFETEIGAKAVGLISFFQKFKRQ